MSDKFFFLLIIGQMLAAGISYLVEITFFSSSQYYHLIRTIRMILIYVLPTLLFMSNSPNIRNELGITFRPSSWLSGYLGGISIYLAVSFVFVKYRIFFDGWGTLSISQLLFVVTLSGIMAAITDFWTRGFILFKVAKKYGEMKAIVSQNLIWFIIHLYEIQLLEPYIGLLYSIFLTLFLGVFGDLIALHSRSIVGLMLGHMILNLLVASVASGNLDQALFNFLQYLPI